MSEANEMAVVRALEGLQGVCQEMRTEIAALRAQQKGMSNEITTLNKLVRDGNGQPSILSEHSAHREAIKKITRDLDEVEKSIETRRTHTLFWLLGLIGTAIMSAASWLANSIGK